MASPNTYAPSREDFKALLEESYGESEAIEGSVIKGKVVPLLKPEAFLSKSEITLLNAACEGPDQEILVTA